MITGDLISNTDYPTPDYPTPLIILPQHDGISVITASFAGAGDYGVSALSKRITHASRLHTGHMVSYGCAIYSSLFVAYQIQAV